MLIGLSDASTTIIAAFVGLLGACVGAVVVWIGAIRAESERQRGDRHNAALADLFSALAANAEVNRRLQAGDFLPAERGELHALLVESRSRYVAAKMLLLSSADHTLVGHLAEADRLGFDGSDKAVRVSATSLVTNLRRVAKLEPVEDEVVESVIFGS